MPDDLVVDTFADIFGQVTGDETHVGKKCIAARWRNLDAVKQNGLQDVFLETVVEVELQFTVARGQDHLARRVQAARMQVRHIVEAAGRLALLGDFSKDIGNAQQVGFVEILIAKQQQRMLAERFAQDLAFGFGHGLMHVQAHDLSAERR